MIIALNLFLALGPLVERAPERAPQPIVDGDLAPTCGWPTAVFMNTSTHLCTGVLVHPQVVVYFGECPTDYWGVSFAEAYDDIRVADVEYCVAHPDLDQPGKNVAVCRLHEPADDVPVVPILMGCDVDTLAAGKAVTIVGVGRETLDGGAGYKRIAEGEVSSVAEQIWVTTEGPAPCAGDVGAPGFVRLDDGTWRVFGTVDGFASGCFGGASFAPLHALAGWLETASGFDVTPCHDPDGTWDPGDRCQKIPREPGVGGGNWPFSCHFGALSGWAATCGPAPEPDDQPPSVALTSPSAQDGFDPDPATGAAEIAVAVAAEDGEGWGIGEVLLFVSGEEAAADPSYPYGWTINLPEGVHELYVRAVDRADNVTDSAPVTVVVGDPPPGEPGTAETGGDSPADSGDGGGGDTGSGSAGADEDADEQGCACRTTANPGPLAGLISTVLLGFVYRRRRGVGGYTPGHPSG